MRKTKTLYWVFTILFGGFMLFSAVPDILVVPDAITFMVGHLGYPKYFIPFIGVAKLLGVIAILIPGFPKIKEWAYAGLFFDLIGATYSQLANGDPVAPVFFMVLPIGIGVLSYVYYGKKIKASSANSFN